MDKSASREPQGRFVYVDSMSGKVRSSSVSRQTQASRVSLNQLNKQLVRNLRLLLYCDKRHSSPVAFVTCNSTLQVNTVTSWKRAQDTNLVVNTIRQQFLHRMCQLTWFDANHHHIMGFEFNVIPSTATQYDQLVSFSSKASLVTNPQIYLARGIKSSPPGVEKVG